MSKYIYPRKFRENIYPNYINIKSENPIVSLSLPLNNSKNITITINICRDISIINAKSAFNL